jgi:hypothetical protein
MSGRGLIRLVQELLISIEPSLGQVAVVRVWSTGLLRLMCMRQHSEARVASDRSLTALK